MIRFGLGVIPVRSTDGQHADLSNLKRLPTVDRTMGIPPRDPDYDDHVSCVERKGDNRKLGTVLRRTDSDVGIESGSTDIQRSYRFSSALC